MANLYKESLDMEYLTAFQPDLQAAALGSNAALFGVAAEG